MNGQNDTDGKTPLSDSEAQTNKSAAADAYAEAAADAAEEAGTDTEPGGLDEQPSEDPNREAKTQAIHEAQLKELTDRLLRAHAEMDNLRKRTEREKADTARYAITKFALDIVGVSDNLKRAMDAAGAPDSHSPELKALFDGVALTGQELEKAFDRHGVSRIDAEGRPFDPHLHQAMMEKPDPSVPSGTVVQVFQDGYVIGDRVLRPSMVVVARGGPKAKAADAEEPGTPEVPPALDDAPPAADASPASDNAPDGAPETPDSPKADGTTG
ncbi:MAG: nucleotide exchange factor GrpE [Pseudomonadota bacterium]